LPGLVWSLLITSASALIGCIDICGRSIRLQGCPGRRFPSSLTLALLTVHVLDFPFESALQLPSRDFNETLEKVDHLIAAAKPPGSRGSE
jgi:hypothetical protein